MLFVGSEHVGEGTGETALHEALEVLDHVPRDRLARVVPDHGAELQVSVKARAVVDGVDQIVRAEEAVAALTVGVVGHEVEDADLLQALAVARVLAHGEPVLLELGFHEELEGALAERAFAHDGGRHEAPAEGLGEEIGGFLALVEAGGKVPEGALAAAGLVDGARAGAVALYFGEQGDVARPGHAALDGDGAVPQQVQRISERYAHCCVGRCDRWYPWARCTRGSWAVRPSSARRRG